MRYIIMDKHLVTKSQLKQAGVQNVEQLRHNYDSTKVVLKVDPKHLKNFAGFTIYTAEDIYIEMAKAEWQPDPAWYQLLFG